MNAQVRRPYRSKRHPPCDRCRQKKLRCDPDNQIACRRCQGSGTLCSFTRLHRAVSMPVAFSSNSPPQYGPGPESDPTIPVIEPGSVVAQPPAVPYLPERPLTYPIAERSAPQQAIQTLDLLPGVSAQVMGTSGESDPFLLRHCKFDDYGLLHFHQVRFRNAGGVPLEEKIPVHYLVTDNVLYDAATASTKTVRQFPSARDELDTMVPVDHGQRLISLFLAHVLPSLPIVPHFIASEDLQTIPVHLLAALYASALPFAKFDDWLSIVHAYQPPPTAQLWRLTIDLILEEIHTPHLSVLQAGLLYLHKPWESSQEAAIADPPFVWSFVGMMVGLATSLGLQLECRPMGMPLWERRMRRRLWWAIYSEDKWRSLLMGRPPYIREDEWDVTDLDEADFETAPAQPFMRVVKMAKIADEVQSSLYSLRAAQRLSSNFQDSFQTSRVLLRKLQEWLSLVTPPLSQDGTTAGPELSTCVHFAYLLLEVFIFRALLRPMVPSKPAPRLIDESDQLPFLPDFTVDDYIAQIIDVEDVLGEDIPEVTVANEDKSIPIVLSAAENCAASMLRLISRMEAKARGTFWYSWCRIGFATVSNFVLLLLVQAPTKEHAVRAKRLVYMWQQALRSQGRGWDVMDLGLIRLNGPLGLGLTKTYYLPLHIREVLESVP
ncbi:fungal-specific transcription factor domain-containing protein [Aspergillus varians]